jgi:hypothetical protein
MVYKGFFRVVTHQPFWADCLMISLVLVLKIPGYILFDQVFVAYRRYGFEFSCFLFLFDSLKEEKSLPLLI